jgi:hypothetical protein
MLGEAVATTTTPVPRKLVFIIAHFTAPPVLSLMVLVHLLDREEGLWMQMTNAVKGTFVVSKL